MKAILLVLALSVFSFSQASVVDSDVVSSTSQVEIFKGESSDNAAAFGQEWICSNSCTYTKKGHQWSDYQEASCWGNSAQCSASCNPNRVRIVCN